MASTAANHRQSELNFASPESNLLIQSNGHLTEHDITGCPSAVAMAAYSDLHNAIVMLTIPCKRWKCPHCGRVKIANYARLTKLAAPTRLITLTVDPKNHETPRQAYDETRRSLSKFSTNVRRQIGEFEYLRVLEATKAGWPHYHLVARCSYIPQKTISTIWASLTGAPICDVRRIKQEDRVYYYVMKYLAKQTAIEWTTRRVSVSKSFFPAKPERRPNQLQLRNQSRYKLPPHIVLNNLFPGTLWERIDRHGLKMIQGPQRIPAFIPIQASRCPDGLLQPAPAT